MNRLPQPALANPDGPIPFIGHVDLAWSYSFEELDSSTGPTNRLRRFLSLLSYALRRDRVGVAFRELVSCAIAARAGASLQGAARPSLDAAPGSDGLHPARQSGSTPTDHTSPAIEARRLTPRDLFPFASTGNLSPRITPSAEKLEEAILHVLVGDRAIDTIVQEYGIDRTELERLATLFLEARRRGERSSSGAAPRRTRPS
jgi:hypothetical protein